MKRILFVAALVVLATSSAMAAGPKQRTYVDRNGTVLMRSYRASDGRETYYSPYGRKLGSSNVQEIGGTRRRTYVNQDGTRLGTATRQHDGRVIYHSPFGHKTGSSTKK